jgi:sulfonate transport system substrate-binding protein
MNTTRPHLRRAAGALAATLLAVGAAACGSSSDSSSSTPTASNAAASAPAASSSSSAAPVTTATTTSTVAGTKSGGKPLIVGDQAGTGAQALLEAAGLLHKLPFPVKFADFTSGPPILQALSSGSLDVGGVGDAPPVFAAAGGDKIAIVGALRNSTKDAGLLVPKGSSVTSISQLKGKKIAVAQGSSADYHLLATLTKAGLTPHDVQLVYLQPAQGLAAFTSGSVAGWDIWPPFVEQAEVLKGAKNIADGTGIVNANYSYTVASKSAISDPVLSKEITQYLTVLNQAHVWANTHAAQWAKTWAAATGLPDSVMAKAAADSPQTPVPVDATITAAEQSLVGSFSKAGLIPKSYSFSPYISTAFNSSVQ